MEIIICDCSYTIVPYYLQCYIVYIIYNYTISFLVLTSSHADAE